MVESNWAEDMGQFLFHLDPHTRKITRSLEKMKLKTINKQCSIVFNKTCLNNNMLPKYTLFKTYVDIDTDIDRCTHTHTHTHTHTYIYIYIYIYVCIYIYMHFCVSLCVKTNI